jgi:hypothetical protein
MSHEQCIHEKIVEKLIGAICHDLCSQQMPTGASLYISADIGLLQCYRIIGSLLFKLQKELLILLSRGRWLNTDHIKMYNLGTLLKLKQDTSMFFSEF